MARKRINPSNIPDVIEQFDALLPHQAGFYAGAIPHRMAPLLAELMGRLGAAGRPQYKARLEAFRRTGHPTIDELGRELGLAPAYTEGLLTGWHGLLVAADRVDPDFLAGLADGVAAREAAG